VSTDKTGFESAVIQAHEQEPVRRIKWSKIIEIHLHESREEENKLESLDLGEQDPLRQIGEHRTEDLFPTKPNL
jgi:hypothetical protein